MKIFITGATGFIGHHLVPRLLESGHKVRCLVRDPGKVSTLPLDRVELVQGDVTDRVSLNGKLNGADAVVHLVGIIREKGQATHERVVVGGTRNLLDAAVKAGISLFYYQSALGARPKARARYHQAKWMAEEMTRESGLPFSILRPSVVYGPGDDFTPILIRLVKTGPFIPIVGSGKALLQPMYVSDLLTCIQWCLESPESAGRTIEIGGPEQISFEDLVDITARAVGIRKTKVHLSVDLMKSFASLLEGIQGFPVTRDQLIMLEEDNICDTDVLSRIFNITPVRLDDRYPSLVRDIVSKQS